MRFTFLVTALLAAGCNAPVQANPATVNQVPDNAECQSFDWHDSGRTCRILWCWRYSAGGAGPAVLWCDSPPPDAGAAR